MKNIIQCLSKMEEYNLDKNTIQSCFNNIQANRRIIDGYTTRIFLIHLRAYEKKCRIDLDEVIGDTTIYALKLAQEYIDKALYIHHSGHNKFGYKDDLYCNYQCYCQSLKLRIKNILDNFKKENPTHPLCEKKYEFTQSELEYEEMQNDIIDVLNENKRGMI